MKSVFFCILFIYITNLAHSQVSLKYLEDNLSPVSKEILELLKAGKDDEANKLAGQEIAKLNKIIHDRSAYSKEERNKYIIDLSNIVYNVSAYTIQKDSLPHSLEETKNSIETLLTLSKQLFGENHLQYAYMLSYASYFYFKTGEYNKAEEFNLKAIQIYKEQLGTQHIRYFDESARLANLYLETGEPEKANYILSEIGPMLKDHYNKDNFDYFEVSYNLAYTNFLLYKFNQASVYYEQSIESLKLLQNKYKNMEGIPSLIKQTEILYEHIRNARFNLICANEKYDLSVKPDSSNSFNKFCEELYNQSNDIDGIIFYANIQFFNLNIELSHFLYKKALQLETAKNGAESPLSKEFREDVQATESIEGVRGRMKKILAEKEKKYGVFSEEALDLNCFLLRAYEEDVEQLSNYCTKIQQILTVQVKKKINFLSEAERASWWKYIYEIQMYIKFLNIQSIKENNQFQLSGNIYDSELLSKGLLLNSSQIVKQSILQSGDTSLINSWLKLEKLKEAEKVILEEQIAQLERSLAEKSQSYREQQSSFDINWKQIRQALRPGEMAIEFFDIDAPIIPKAYYCALLLTSKDPYPTIIFIETIDSVNQAYTDSRNGDNQILYHAVWEPLEKYLKNIKTIYIAPSGILHSISFSGIKKGDHYLCDDYTIHNLLSTRDIINLKNQKTDSIKSKQIALFGGADYGLPVAELANLDSDLKRGSGFAYLSGSKEEVLKIDTLLSDLNWKTYLFIDKEATETRFKSLSSLQSPNVIHISTHGFYFPQPKKEEEVPATVSTSNVYRLSDNPLMRSGLAFSGANHVWKGNNPEDGVDDGILTAYDISNMNLTHTELVVLSACNSGLGDIDQSEGVFGLQRAFRLAGVQTMVLSLWDVPDKETVELMTEFYTLWTQGLDKKKAFDQAQLKLRYKYPDNPEKWAGFVMIE